MYTYMHKYAYKYTYICICDSFIVGNFGNPLYFVEIGYYTRFIAHPITKSKFRTFTITRLCSKQAEIIHNREKENVGQGEARHRKYL
jgi:hypothetical protein